MIVGNEESLPQNWCLSLISEFAEINPTINKAEIPDDLEVAFVPMASVQAENGDIDANGVRRFSEVKKGYTLFIEGDVLFAKITPCMENGKMAVAPALKNNIGFGSTEFHVLRCSTGISPHYLYYYVSSKSFRQLAEHYMTGAVGQKRVTAQYLSNYKIPIPPTNEQHRIVAKIEALFSELDKGIESFKTAREQLKIYRQALLKHAFSGKLTEQWRAERDNIPQRDVIPATAEVLLQRIQAERQQRYQQQLKDWEDKSPSIPLLQRGKRAANHQPCTASTTIPPFEKGGTGGISKPKPPKTLPPLTAEELAELPELPAGWIYSYLADLGDLGRGKSKHRPRNDPRLFGGSFPFIQTGEVKSANRIIRKYTNTLSDFGLQQSKLWPTGTLCITIAANIAETAFLGFDGCFPDSVVGFSAFETIVAPEYIDFFIQAVRTRIEAYAPATAQKNINLETLENLVVPYCCLNEQKQIIDILDERFSVLDQFELSISASLQQAEALRQSILKKAFSGQLVPQDPNDEPASVLLERINAEKALKKEKKKG